MPEKFISFTMNFSAYTTPYQVQSQVTEHLEKRRRHHYGAPFGKKLVIFVDDLNMPFKNTWGD
jgi:hypothetical protein